MWVHSRRNQLPLHFHCSGIIMMSCTIWFCASQAWTKCKSGTVWAILWRCKCCSVLLYRRLCNLWKSHCFTVAYLKVRMLHAGCLWQVNLHFCIDPWFCFFINIVYWYIVYWSNSTCEVMDGILGYPDTAVL